MSTSPDPGPADLAQLALDYARDGVVCVRGVVGPALLARVATAIDDNVAHPSPLAQVASGIDDPGLFVEDFCNWHRFPAYLELAQATAAVARSLMGSRSVRLYHDHLLVKEAGTRQPTPWHQDQPYYDVDGRDVISMWLPVDPVPREATLEFVAGTHAGPWLMPRTFMRNEAKWFPEGSLVDVPDVEADRDGFPILGWALQPGDAVFFHGLTLHAAQGATGRRRVVSIRYLGDDARRVPRQWRCSPPIPADATFPLLIDA
ncbi:MAG: phytanoyl-CoA dioxygenase family protein [Actinomycetota bacterium]|nr:phytanoyl-CoA dioxygenase family protein [Actinomycetota bacterium]